jgi:hypothetical protein
MTRDQIIQKVRSKLPGLPEPRILIRVPGTVVRGTPQEDAKTAAEHFNEPVAIASADGELLAYCIPD